MMGHPIRMRGPLLGDSGEHLFGQWLTGPFCILSTPCLQCECGTHKHYNELGMERILNSLYSKFVVVLPGSNRRDGQPRTVEIRQQPKLKVQAT